MDGGARLRPPAAAPPLFFLPSILGGARELLSVAAASLVVAGTGVAFDSDDLSAISGTCIDGELSSLMADGLGSDGNCESTSCGKRSTTIRLFSAAFLVVVAVANIILTLARCVVDVAMRWCASEKVDGWKDGAEDCGWRDATGDLPFGCSGLGLGRMGVRAAGVGFIAARVVGGAARLVNYRRRRGVAAAECGRWVLVGGGDGN